MKPLYYGVVSTSNLFSACARSKAKELDKPLVSHFPLPRVPLVIISRVFTPV
jgi:hypothetical protein